MYTPKVEYWMDYAVGYWNLWKYCDKIAKKYGIKKWDLYTISEYDIVFSIEHAGKVPVKEFFSKVSAIANELTKLLSKVVIDVWLKIPKEVYPQVSECLRMLSAELTESHDRKYYIAEIRKTIKEEKLNELPKYIQCLQEILRVAEVYSPFRFI